MPASGLLASTSLRLARPGCLLGIGSLARLGCILSDLDQGSSIVVRGATLDHSGRAEDGAADAMMTIPASIGILDFPESLDDLPIPLLPGFTAGDDQRFTGHQVAEKFLAPVVAKATQQVFIIEPVDLGLACSLGICQVAALVASNANLAEVFLVDHSGGGEFPCQLGIFHQLLCRTSFPCRGSLSTGE